MSKQEVPGIYKKLHAIMGEANYIQKDKENKFHGYKYASEAAIKECLHALFVKHGVLPYFSTCNQQSTEIKTKKGDIEYRTLLDLMWKFTDIEDGSSVEGTMVGSGAGESDKATYKAITGALKYCLTSQFIIPTGDDPESDNGDKSEKRENKRPANKERTSTTIAPPPLPLPNPVGSVEHITVAQRDRFIAIYKKASWSDEDVKKLLADFGVHSRNLILKKDYDKLCGIVESGDYATYVDFKTNAPAAS